MSEYSIVTNNRFALSIDEDEDLYELLEKQQAEKKLKAELAAEEAAKLKAKTDNNSKTKNDKKNSAKLNNKRIVKPNDTNTQQAPVANSNSNKGPTTYNRNANPNNASGNRPPRFERQTREGTGEKLNFEKPPQEFNNRERRGGLGGRGGRGMRGGFGSNRPRREFERHSGSDKTGVKAVEKRDGFGPHNWGDEIQAQLDQPADQQKDSAADQTEESAAPTTLNGDQNPTEEGDATEEAVELVDEGPKEMTLAEWKASQTKTKVEFKVRRANEGTDTKQWKGTVALQKKKKGDSSDEYEDSDEDDEVEIGATRATLEKLNIEIKFREDSSRSSGPRGGRGGFRGGRGGPRGGRGGPRGGFEGGRGGFSRRSDDNSSNNRRNVPRVDNEADFPTLGSR